jgi:hypothetical protein
MKVKIEDLGTSYRIYELAYTEPLRWPTGEEFIVSYANAKYLFNQKQLQHLQSNEFLFNLSRSRISYAMKVFGGNPRMFADEDIDEVIKEMQANEAAAVPVDGATLTPKFADAEVTAEATADAEVTAEATAEATTDAV